MERKLASIQQVHHIQPIYTLDGEEANSIELAHVLGWSVIVKKGEFQDGDLCVFFEIDSILPETEWSEFLRSKKFHIKTMKLNNMRTNNQPVISQGLALSLYILPDEFFFDFPQFIGIGLDNPTLVGYDVTGILGVTKYEKVEEWTRAGVKLGKPFHPFIPKTDELRLQSFPDVLKQMQGLPYYITQKLDGTSCTVVKDDDGLHVYSRNLEVGEDSNYYQTALECGIIQAALDHPFYAIQGEICGANIQGNRLGLKKNQFYTFNIFDILNSTYLDYNKFIANCEAWNIQHVPLLDIADDFDYTIEELEKIANSGCYENGFPQEGIVVRPIDTWYSSIVGGRLSFKVINVNFLLKVKE